MPLLTPQQKLDRLKAGIQKCFDGIRALRLDEAVGMPQDVIASDGHAAQTQVYHAAAVIHEMLTVLDWRLYESAQKAGMDYQISTGSYVPIPADPTPEPAPAFGNGDRTIGEIAAAYELLTRAANHAPGRLVAEAVVDPTPAENTL